MAAALKSSVHSPARPDRRSPQLSPRGSATSKRSVVVLPVAGSDSLAQLTPPKPVGRLLSMLHQASSLGTAIAVVLALGGYGYSVQLDRQLSRSENRLAQLQRSEDQLMSVNEVLKNHMAEQVQQTNTGLTPPRLGNVIFLQPAPLPAAATVPASQDTSLPQQPLSY